MKAYAGIGSRTISQEEQQTITRIASTLSQQNWIVYSGNADGTDITFQKGSYNKTVVFLPWKNFNKKIYDTTQAIASFDMGNSEKGQHATDQFHPAPHNLSQGAKRCMNRNYHQIMGHDIYPPVSFVVCCATEIDGKIIGGTGQACRIAQSKNIPIFNIRTPDWESQLLQFLEWFNLTNPML